MGILLPATPYVRQFSGSGGRAVYDEVAFHIRAFRELSTRELRQVHDAHPPGHVLEVASDYELARRREQRKYLSMWVAAAAALALGVGAAVVAT
jgi:hypothetical protein